nr:f-box/kelch-repeat protein [Quercus suber]
MAKHQTVADEEEAPIHGDVLEAILTHVPLIDLVRACHVSTSWKGAVFSSLRHLNPVKPWLIVHAQSTRYPYTTTSHAYDPRSHVWVDIEQLRSTTSRPSDRRARICSTCRARSGSSSRPTRSS